MLTKKNNLWNPGYRILDCSRSRRPLATGWRHITSLNKRLKVLTILSQGSDFSLEFVVFLFREFTVILGTGWFRKKAKPSISSRSQIIPLFLNSWKRIWWSRFITLVPEVFLDFSSRKRSTASREAATTSRVSDEEREKNLWLPWPRISLSCRRQLSNASNC